MADLARELRYVLRSLARSPGFSAAVVLTLALGIGATAAAFGLVRGVLLRPLAYLDPEGLVSLYESSANDARLASFPTFLDWQRQNDAFDAMAYIRGLTVSHRTRAANEQVVAGFVTADFFRVVGERPMLGRAFSPDENSGAGAPAVVVSYDFWRRELGGTREAVGRPLLLDDADYTVIGVMPKGFAYPDWAAIWLPIAALPASDRLSLGARGLHVDSRVIARYRAGVDSASAQVRMDQVARRLAAAYPGESGGWTRVVLSPIRNEILGDAGTRLLILQATVLLVLAIGCANLVNLWLARGLARTQELALRAALGAGRGRLIGQLLLESLVLALAGGTLGALLGAWTIRAVKATTFGVLPRLDEVSFDPWVLGFALLLSAATALMVALPAAIRATKSDLVAELAGGGRLSSGGLRTTRVRSLLVVGEIAIAMVLQVGSALLLRSLARLDQVRLGFDPERLVTLRVFPATPTDPDRAMQLYTRLREAVAGVPGIASAALSNHVPLTGASMPTRVSVAGAESPPEGGPTALFRTISPEYFDTMSIPLRQGRGLERGDLTAGSEAMVVNEAFVRRYLGGGDPLGRRITVRKSVQGRPDFGDPMEGVIVGVAGDVRHFGQEADVVPEVYLPITRNPPSWISLVARTRGNPESMLTTLMRTVSAVDPDLAVPGGSEPRGFVTMNQLLAATRAPRVLNTLLLSGLGAAALLLAMIGLAGVVAYLVVRRTRELGVRIALGAGRGDVLRLVLRDHLRLILAGVALGALGGLGLNRFLGSLLFGVTTTDPTSFLLAGATLTVVALVAGYLPASRAAAVDPVIALRSE
jgi:putative ABC transport system permease protein